MFVNVALLVGGLLLLTLAADRFVLGAARLATALHVSPLLVGAVVIGFGTSAPEMVVTVLATLSGSQDLAFGNVVGSNTANVLLVLGGASLLAPLSVRVATLRRELPLMLAACALLALVTVDRSVTTLDAVVLLAATVVVMGAIARAARRDREAIALLEAEVAQYEHDSRPRVGRALATSVLGLAGTLVGAQVVVWAAVALAEAAGLSEALVGLTVVAVGTSLPELVTALQAARRQEAELVVGNVLGSNIFNALPIAGVAGLLDTVQLSPAFPPSLAIMVGSCALVAVFLRTGHQVARSEGAVLLLLFVGSLALTAAIG